MRRGGARALSPRLAIRPHAARRRAPPRPDSLPPAPHHHAIRLLSIPSITLHRQHPHQQRRQQSAQSARQRRQQQRTPSQNVGH